MQDPVVLFCLRSFAVCFELIFCLDSGKPNFSFSSLTGGVLLNEVASLLAFIMFEILFSFDFEVESSICISLFKVFFLERLKTKTVGTKMIAVMGRTISRMSPDELTCTVEGSANRIVT